MRSGFGSFRNVIVDNFKALLCYSEMPFDELYVHLRTPHLKIKDQQPLASTGWYRHLC
jgi:hypothetical protein